MRWSGLLGLALCATSPLGCGGDEPTGGDCTPRTEEFVDDRLVPGVQFAEANKTGELSCALICPPGTTSCQDLGDGTGVGGTGVGGMGVGGMGVGGMGVGGMTGVGGMASAGGGPNAGGAAATGGSSPGGGNAGGAPSGDAHLVRCSGTVSYPCGG